MVSVVKNEKKIIKVKTKMGLFDCVFESNDPEKGYTVIVPKLKGIVTCGDDLTEAKKMVREAIELHCRCLLEEDLAEVRPLAKNKVKELARV